jgi:hypothetical protein
MSYITKRNLVIFWSTVSIEAETSWNSFMNLDFIAEWPVFTYPQDSATSKEHKTQPRPYHNSTNSFLHIKVNSQRSTENINRVRVVARFIFLEAPPPPHMFTSRKNPLNIRTGSRPISAAQL